MPLFTATLSLMQVCLTGVDILKVGYLEFWMNYNFSDIVSKLLEITHNKEMKKVS